MKCKDCGAAMRELDFSKVPELELESGVDGVVYECKRCGTIEPDEKLSTMLTAEMRNSSADKTIKVDRNVWERVNHHIKKHRTSYPSLKFFTQRALLEKLEKESGN
jgi:hypothetical protein